MSGGIAHVTSVHPRGDTRIAIKEAATLMAHFGDVTLFVQDGLGPGTGPGGVSVIDVGARPAGRLARMVLGGWRMARAIPAARPRIAHFHDPELIPAALWWKLRGIRVIYDAHEDLPHQVLSKYWIPRPLRRVLAGLTRLAERMAGAAFDGIVTVTPTIAARFPAARTALVQNFPDLAEMSFPEGATAPASPPRAVYVGGITEIRGVHTMVAAMARVRTPGVRLSMAGAFQPPALEREVAALEGWERVDFIGWADRAEVARLLRQARMGLVLFLPEPNHVEAQPNKLFEYMAAGLPVIASDFPHWRHLLQGIDCALFVDPQDPAAVAEAVDWILDNPESAAEMGARGRRAVRAHFNWTHEAEALLALYRQLSPDLTERA